jgi:hypothetical protein
MKLNFWQIIGAIFIGVGVVGMLWYRGYFG